MTQQSERSVWLQLPAEHRRQSGPRNFGQQDKW